MSRRAVLLDAMGTLVALEPPAPLLARALGIDRKAAAAAVRAEFAVYRAELHMGGTPEGLAALRRRCATVVRDALADPRPVEEIERALLASLRFRVFADVAPALRAWRAAGATLVVVSNWDLTLHEVLAATGLRPAVDAVVTSAEEGIAKPDPELFVRALRRVGARARDALHVGDDLDADVGGAAAAGIEALLLVREGGAPPPGVPAVGSLARAVEHWRLR